MTSLPLTAPSSVRRSKKRAKVYIDLHTRLQGYSDWSELVCERAAQEACEYLLRLVEDRTFWATGGYVNV